MIALYGPKAGIAPPPRPRVPTRKTFSGSIAPGIPGVVKLDVRIGCWVVETDAEGNRVSSKRNDRARLWAEVGDVLICSATDLELDQVLAVTVTAIGQDGATFSGVIACGSLTPGVREVHVQRLKVRP